MAESTKAVAALALHRFGMGPRTGSIAAIASDPRGALLAELDKPGVGRLRRRGLLAARWPSAPSPMPTPSARPSASSAAKAPEGGGRGHAEGNRATATR